MNPTSGQVMLVDIYYNNSDIDSLTWLKELKTELKHYEKWVTFQAHDLNSSFAKKNNITTQCVTLNNRRISSGQLTKIIRNMTP